MLLSCFFVKLTSHRPLGQNRPAWGSGEGVAQVLILPPPHTHSLNHLPTTPCCPGGPNAPAPQLRPISQMRKAKLSVQGAQCVSSG